ncbi:MFS transporter [Rhodococcus sp. NPDC019627]|uniref:MFS transporter n=1 Tax=unclassified Rhodococcus (in: high G+C Gram-positive bacteria) TaxID=192944 RepID=UPI0033D589D5
MTSDRFGELMQPVGRDRIDDGTAPPVTPASPVTRNAARQVLVAVLLNAVCVLPSFLVSSMPGAIASDLQLDPVVLGFAFSAFWLVASVAAYPMASKANIWGPVRALRVAGILAFLLCILLASSARSAGTLVITLGLAGCAPALATPAMNMVIMSAVPARRRASAFAVASTGPVAALMLAGIVGSAFESSIGWRSAFVLSGIAAVLLTPLVKSAAETPPTTPTPPAADHTDSNPRAPSLRPLAVMMVGVLAGNLALGAATAFMVLAAPAAGMDSDHASLAVSAGAGASIVLRLVCAALVDRRGWDPFPMCWLMMLAGAVGFGFLASSASWTYVLGLLLALGPGWSWISLLVHGVMCRYPHAVARASGIVQSAYFIGGVIGPVIMGVIIATSSYSAAWSVMVGAQVTAALFVILAGRRLPPFAALPSAEGDRPRPD